MPAYFFDPCRYRAHKMKGGTFQNYPDKSYLQLTDDQIAKHLNGEQVVGLYPLLSDNTSWFIAADFDEGDWIASCKKFIKACNDVSLQAYFERSRSGNGGHSWIFFDKPFSAFKSRKVILSLLTSSGIVSAFDKNTSFDRLFPNQDYHSGKGFGNLIALPLNGTSLLQGNSCFIDLITLEPRKSNKVCIFTAPFALRNFTHGNRLKHWSMAELSKAYTILSISRANSLSCLYRRRASLIRTCAKSA